jgi:hypothetical protein
VDLPAVDQGLVLTLTWAAVPGAVGYRVYRTNANQAAESIALLAEVLGGSTSLVDDGTRTPDPTATPMPPGSIGVWHPVAPLLEARAEHAVVTVPGPDPATFFLYAVGGLGAGGVLASGEVATVTIGAGGVQTISVWRPLTASLNPARRALAGGMSILDTDTPLAGGETLLFFAGGRVAAGTVSGVVEGAKIEADGDVLQFTSVEGPNPGRAGAGGTSANGFVYLFGGLGGGASRNDVSSQLRVPGAGQGTPIAGTNVNLTQWDGLGPGNMINARLDLAVTKESAFFFLGGGTGDGGAVLSSFERTVQ